MRTASLLSLEPLLRRACFALLLLPAVACMVPAATAQTQPRTTVSKPAGTLPGPRYAWVAMPARLAAESDARVQDATFRKNLQAGLDKALQAKGYRPVPAGEADVLLAYRVGVRDSDQVVLRETPTGDTPQAAITCKAGGCSQLVVRGETGTPVLDTRVKHATEGALQVEVLEPREIRVLWRGTLRGDVKRTDATQARLDAAAREVLAELPAAR